MSTKVNVTTTATKPTVYVAQTGDVTVEAIQNGDVVVDVAYNPVGTTSGDVYGPASSTDNAIARFDGVTGKVIQNSNITIADGASGTLSGTNTGDQNLFGTIAVSGQSDIVADSTNDTLTFVAGSNITITTDPSTDAITIASTGGSGSGTVTSVAISGTDGIQVDSGSPITTSGTIQLGVDAPTMKTTLNLAGTNTGDQNVFSTFAVAGQSNVVADSTADTLTLVAGSNITITTDASTDSITINSTASGSGDVVGPASSTDNALVRFDGTTGKLVQNGQITESDTGDLAAVNSITMDTTPSGSLTTQGQMMWNNGEETLDIQLNGFALHVGEHVVYHVKNSTGSTIAKGVPVMFAGTTGNSGQLLIQPWDGTGLSTLFMGLTAESLTDGSEGFVIAFGKLRGIETDGANYGETWADGDIIYAGTTAGSLTNVTPSAPDSLVQVAAVVHAQASNGTLFIRTTPILGDVFGPASATSNDVALFDGTTGKLIKDGGTFSSLIASSTNAATSKTTPVDADEFPLVDSAASYSLKKLTWANLKATAKTYFDTLYQPLATILTTLSGLANSQGVLTNNGSGTLSYTPTTNSPNGSGDAGKLPLLNSFGGLTLGSDSVIDETPIQIALGFGYGMSIDVNFGGTGVYSQLDGGSSQAFHAHVTASSTGNHYGFDSDMTGGAGVNFSHSGLVNPSGYLFYGREYISGTGYDRFTIDAQGDHTWYKNGTTISSGTDKTTLTYATPSGTNTITLPAVTGNVVTTGDTGTVTPTMLSDAQLISIAALSYTGNAGKVVAVNGAENNFELITVSGTGTVTSVAISGTDGIEVDSGSPITGAGTIQLGVNTTTMKTTLDLSGTNSGDVTLSGTPDYITISGQTITRGLIDLTTDVAGDLPLTNFTQASAASKLLGRGSASGGGDFEEITLGSGLSMSGTTLSASGGSSNVDVKLYTADDTWTNPSPSTAKRVFVKLVGGGAGGGSGRKGAAGTNRYGGSGGAPGATVETWFLTTDLASTISVTIGAGGTGGAAVTANSTDGNNGTAGGTTTFSTVSAVGGLAGVRGTATSANQPGGKSSSCLFGLTSAASLAAGSGSNTTGASVAASIASFPTGGGGGGGLNTSNTTASGGAGGGLGEGTYMQLVAGGTAGSAGNNGGNGNSARGVGTGGGGGGSSASGNAGAGGNGGGYGAGGGGGGASTDSVGDSGRGGDGSGGYALIITYT